MIITTKILIFVPLLILYEFGNILEARNALPELDNVPERTMALHDSNGFQVIYRGVNARAKGIFDVDFDDGRKPLQLIPYLKEDDFQEMKKLGFNFLRLPVNWSGIAPKPDQFSMSYVKKINAVLDMGKKYQIDILLDMHQDAFSKEIGEDGAPDWAIYPRGFKRNEGGKLGNLTLKRIALDTQRAFASFWKNRRVKGKKLWDHFAEAIIFLLDNTANHPAFAGLEILNEPWVLHTIRMYPDDIYTSGLHIDMLWNFYKHVIAKIRKKHKDIWLYIEPDVSKSASVPFLTDEDQLFKATGLPKDPPWKTYRTVYAPHLYTVGMFLDGMFGSKLDPNDPGIKTSIEYSLVEGEQIEAPFVIGEFGFSNKAGAYEETLHNIMDFADKHLFHTAQWVWKEASQGSWGFWNYNKELKKFEFRQEIAQKTARAYPSKISGDIKSISLERKSKSLKVELFKVKAPWLHTFIWPVHYGYPNSPTVKCGDSAVNYTMNEYGDIVFECRSKKLIISG